MASWIALMNYDGNNWQYYNYSNSGLLGDGIADVTIDSGDDVVIDAAGGYL